MTQDNRLRSGSGGRDQGHQLGGGGGITEGGGCPHPVTMHPLCNVTYNDLKFLNLNTYIILIPTNILQQHDT